MRYGETRRIRRLLRDVAERHEVLSNPFRMALLSVIKAYENASWSDVKRTLEKIFGEVNPNTLVFHIGRLMKHGLVLKDGSSKPPTYTPSCPKGIEEEIEEAMTLIKSIIEKERNMVNRMSRRKRPAKTGLKEILKRLSKASKELSTILGDEFIGMILFGSWAREEAKPESDIDVLVVLRRLKGMTVRSKIYGILVKYVRRPLTLVDIRLSDIAEGEVLLTPLMVNIAADAIVIWDPEGAVKSFIEKARKLVEKAGLVRYRTPDGKYGWNRTDGKPMEAVGV
ncbi:MAG: nucleotidyltransferase domain-containing protein [Thermoproteota archaeon]